MKRLFVLALAALVTTGAMAQGTFTIRRPLDGAIVREGVKIRIPKNSVPENGYITFYVNGKFLEATLPEIDGEDYVYNLDTQYRELAEGAAKIEAALVVDVNGKPQTINRTSVNVTVDNKTSIVVPEGGMKLRYKFVPGAERVYDFTVSREVGMVSQAQAQLGSRTPMIASDDMKIRVLYAIDNVYSTKEGKEALMRIQLLPNKGKDYATIIPLGATSTTKIEADQMLPLYMRISDVGREAFGALPIYFGIDGRNGALPQTQYYPILPLPVLPSRAIKPSEAFPGTHQFGNVDKTKAYDQDSFTKSLASRGEFLGVQWFHGMPCAKIRTTVALGPQDLKNVKDLGEVKGQASNVKFEGTYWFSLNKGIIVRMEDSVIQEAIVDVGSAPSGGSGDGNGGSSGPSLSKKGPIGAGGGNSAPGVGGDWMIDPTGFGSLFDPQTGKTTPGSLLQNRGRGKSGPAGGGNGASSLSMGGGDDEKGSRGGGQAGGRFGQRSGGGGGPRKMVMRVKTMYTAELEQ